MNDDEDSALPIEEQTQRPPNTALHQQRVNAWHPILDPVWVIAGLIYLGIIMVPVGYKIDSIQRNVEEHIDTYDKWTEDYFDTFAYDPDNDTDCRIGNNFNAKKRCYIRFTATKDLTPPILLHYQLTNFHQNHRSYYSSRDPYQLLGEADKQDAISAQDCNPLNVLGGIKLNPCGLIANTFFNDIFTLNNTLDANGNEIDNFILREDGIAWQSDLKYKFRQVNGFEHEPCSEGTCDESCCKEGDSCLDGKPYYDKVTDKCYRYKYPKDDTTQYLYETYRDIISPLDGVMDEHFIVWMRIATQPTFRKLYGWIDEPIPKGTTLVFAVTSNYVVTRFKGSKSLILSTTSIFGGKNPFLAPIFISVGIVCLVAGALFGLKHAVRPRKLADPAYLHYKED
jgi:hypothetical protein